MATAWRWLAWIATGVVLTVLLLAVLRPLAEAQMQTAMRGEFTEILPLAIGLVALGGVLGIVIIIRGVHPLVPGVMAVLLAVFYGYPTVVSGFSGWPNDWANRTFLVTAGTLPYLLIGILVGIGLWRALDWRGGDGPEPSE